MGVLVIGMHRSGTSALASVLEALGLDPGPASGSMSSDVGNPEGYFEQRSVAELNDEILGHYGGRWDSPPLLARGWALDLTAQDFVRRARDILSSSYQNQHYVLKDPRISLLLPLWRQAVLDRCCAVVIVRDPSEVAWSLALRNGLPALTGLALWAGYNRSLLGELSGLSVHVCSYSDLVENPREVIGDIVVSLQAWGEIGADVDVEGAIARVKADLRRDTRPASEAELASPPAEITALMKLITDRRGRHDTFDVASSLDSGWWEGPLLEERRTILQQTTAVVNEVEGVNRDLLMENAALRDTNTELRGQVAVLVDQVQRVRRFLPVTIIRRFWRRLSDS